MKHLNYLLLINGALIFLAYKFKRAKKKPDYKFSIFIGNNTPDVIINMLVGNAMIMAGVNIPFKYLDIDWNMFLWVIVGFAGQILFNKLMSKFTSDLKKSNEKA